MEFEWPLYKIADPHEENDVLLKSQNDESGPNIRFRNLLESRCEEYASKSKMEQPLMAVEILKEWRLLQPPGRFLIVEEGTSQTLPLWKDVGDKQARTFISKTLKQMVKQRAAVAATDKEAQRRRQQEQQRDAEAVNGATTVPKRIETTTTPISANDQDHSNSTGTDDDDDWWDQVSSSKRLKLYDREVQSHALLEAYQRRTAHPDPPPELVLITGPSGTGKTSLAKQVLEDHVVTLQQGFFLVGKFDQYRNKAQPFSAFMSAIEQFTQSVRAKGTEFCQQVKSTILQSAVVASHIHLLVDAMPCLGEILGTEGEASSSDDDSSTNKGMIMVENNRKLFTAAFKGLMQAVIRPQHPIVLLLDDLQWADEGSLDLLTAIASPSFGDSQGLVIVGTCRGNEVGLHDPLSIVLRNLEENNTRLTDIQVSNLTVDTVSQMLVDLGMPPTQSTSLARIVHLQTKGNAFFASQYIQRVYEDGLMKREVSISGDQKHFLNWNEEDLSVSTSDGERSSTDDTSTNDNRIVRLLAKKMKQLPQDVQEVLKVASCLGNELHESVLCHAGAVASSTVLLGLSVAEERNMIVYDFDRCAGKFPHDRFQEAAFSLIPPEQRVQYQLQLGRNLRQHLPARDFEKHMLLVASLLAQGGELIEDADEREKIARLCLAAARRAAKASAFSSATEYVELGISFLERRHWRDQYELSLLLFNSGAELAHCSGDHETVDRLTAQVSEHARSSEDRFQADICRIMSLDSRTDVECLHICLSILDDLGERVPRRAPIELEFKKTERMLRGRTPDRILALSPMTDRKALAAMQVLHLLYPICLLHKFVMTKICACRLVRLTLAHGQSAASGLGFAFYSVVLVRLGKSDEGSVFARMALQMTARAFRARTTFVVSAYVKPETESMRACLQPLQFAYRFGLKTGDVHASMISLFFHHTMRFFLGDPLDSVVGSLLHLEKLCKDYGQIGVIIFSGPVLQSCYNLMGRSPDPLLLKGDAMNEDDFRHSDWDFNQSMYSLSQFFKLHLAVYLNQFEYAIEGGALSANARQQAKLLVIPFTVKHLTFLECVLAESPFAAKRNNNLLERRRRKRRLKRLQEAALLCPENYSHKLSLAEAEQAVSRGQFDLAIQKYEKSIRLAERDEIRSDQGLACERAARMYLSIGKKAEASKFVAKALAHYQDWGAKVKVDQMTELVKKEELVLP
ncbi:Protein tyrosine kinase [Seminavis robusta]|uniref:Protein tyrosine kinase n=1 Tax=Seminavis robusta TaxID=568900 RepID=A0A9N8E347_9STRA|nr:Protein tyrosine kinase [Seminavis robusta]|eukprot:Sro508_g156620.1 Protein tyrosine kinase (1196) ;mRNA; f:625-4465